jgi:hypothetical protein
LKIYDVEHTQTKELITSREEKDKLIHELFSLKNQNHHLEFIIDSIEKERDNAIEEIQAMIQQVSRPIEAQTWEGSIHDKDEEKLKPLEDKSSELSNKLMDLDVGLKLKVGEIAQLRSPIAEMDILMKAS